MKSPQVSVPPLFAEFRIEDTRQTLAQRFEQQVCRYATRPAVKYHQRELTYAELNGAANRVAHAILRRGGTGRAPVAVVCDTALSTIVASLGALKAGRAFAPLDPRLPPAAAKKLFSILESRVVLTDEKSAKRCRDVAGASPVRIDIDDLNGRAPAENPRTKVSPDALAYVNFTSGSTGTPKGVMWNHHSELFGIRVKTNALAVAASDRISLLRGHNVGAARDMFLALLNGAALITLDLDESGLAALDKWLRAEAVSIFSCVATIFRHALQGLSAGDCFPAVRLVHIGGEPLFKADVELYRKYFSADCLFVGRYSISETQAVSYFFIDKNSEMRDQRVPAGYPLEGNKVAVLDAAGKPVRGREVGEIAVQSAYLASGYWRQPELTRARFSADSNGTRRYLTGDLGYQLPDGCLVHVGRKDFQAKIRGHRVETTAIETALHEIPSVRQAVVTSRKDAAGGDRLIAYVVPDRRGASERGEWRAYLKARLPDYMVPSEFVVLERLPVTAGGKIDRRRLPETSERRRRRAAPRTAVEKVLARFWNDALKIETAGVGDDFAALGGDSLQAAQIVRRVQELFRIDQPMHGCAQAATIEEMAAFVAGQEASPGDAEKIAAMFLQVASLSNAQVAAALQRYKESANDG